MAAVINKIALSGFANIGHVELHLGSQTVLVAPNGYGKSNLLRALRFALNYIGAPGRKRKEMMCDTAHMPHLAHMARMPFSFTCEGTISHDGRYADFEYHYLFHWAKPDAEGRIVKDGEITEEWLRLRSGFDVKFKQLIRRVESGEAFYTPSESGRCSKPLPLTGLMLAVEKLSYFDDLFFAEKLRQIIASRAFDVSAGIENGMTGNSRKNSKKELLMAKVHRAMEAEASLLLCEEPENSLHPTAQKELMAALASALTVSPAQNSNAKMVLSSHSPFVAQSLPAEHIYVGMPSADHTATFRSVRHGKMGKLSRAAAAERQTPGEYLLLHAPLFASDDETVGEYF